MAVNPVRGGMRPPELTRVRAAPDAGAARRRAAAWLLTGLLAGGCQAGSGNRLEVPGTVSWQGGRPLPADAVVRVELQDVSRADAVAPVLATVEILSASAPPVPFQLTADRAGIDPRARLNVGVRITADGRLLYISDTATLVPLTGPAQPVVVTVVPVAAAPAATAP